MAKKKSKQCGVGAVVWAYTKYIHPFREVRSFYPNMTDKCKMIDLLVIGREVRRVQKKDQLVVLFRHDHFPNMTIYSVKRWIHITKEGDPAHFFDVNAVTSAPDPEESIEDVPGSDEIPDRVFHSGNNSEDIAHIRSLGLDVDDDNEPAPENIPDEDPLPELNQTWGWDGIDHRAVGNHMNVKPVLTHRLGELPRDPSQEAIASLFMTLFPTAYLENTILKATNKNLDAGVLEVTMGELLRFIGIWLFLATTAGFPRRDYFSKQPVHFLYGAPYRVNMWMSRNRFETILKSLKFTTASPPPFKDPFWQIRNLQKAWNDNMAEVLEVAG